MQIKYWKNIKIVDRAKRIVNLQQRHSFLLKILKLNPCYSKRQN
ncbi:unnamed protein product [Paramecium octaurelia]|uniref:Uncharacterized protein n=1 Tax=Paramecium octaurelia TaxID=43137 RepID=A0A8S1SBG2_PAROT|nr:unnamed protein product [Paramecium octaurelia]